MDQNPFSLLSFSEKQIVYLGLLELVKGNSGVGFHNCDQGHVAYAIGRDGTYDDKTWGDSPERNKLFRMMHTLSVDLSEAELDRSAEISDYVFSWSDFCTLAYQAYEEHKDRTS